MSTPQFGARVLSSSGRTLSLQVLVISEDSALPTEKDVDFFVRLLAEDERSGIDGELFDEEWMEKHARDFIRSLSIRNVRELEPRSSSLPEGSKRWTDEESLSSAEFVLTLTDERFAKHLKLGDCWESTAYADELWADEEDFEDDEEVGFFARLFRRFGFELV